jgi:hypothetical protein
VSEPTAKESTTQLEEEAHPAAQLRVVNPPVTHVPVDTTTLSYLETPSVYTDEPQPCRSQRTSIPSQKILDNLNQHTAASAMNVDTGKLCEYL